MRIFFKTIENKSQTNIRVVVSYYLKVSKMYSRYTNSTLLSVIHIIIEHQLK